MKKSTRILIIGLFLILAFLCSGAIFDYLGLDFGPFQMLGSAVAGLLGALRLTSG